MCLHQIVMEHVLADCYLRIMQNESKYSPLCMRVISVFCIAIIHIYNGITPAHSDIFRGN